MKSVQNANSERNRAWQTTQYANLIRYVPSGKYYARIRVQGKLIRQSLKTTKISVAKLRLADLEKQERQKAESHDQVFEGNMNFADAAAIYSKRVEGDASLKKRTKAYHQERLKALFKSWPELKGLDLRKISKTDCLNWAADFGKQTSPSAYNHTVSLLRNVIDKRSECPNTSAWQ